MSATFDHLRTATTLAAYFVSQETAEGDEWTSGRVAAQGWLGLLNDRETIDGRALAEVDALVDVGNDDSGTAWSELRIAYRHWRRTASGGAQV